MNNNNKKSSCQEENQSLRFSTGDEQLKSSKNTSVKRNHLNNSDGYIPIPRGDVFWKLPPDELYVFRWFLHEASYKTHKRLLKSKYQKNYIIIEKRGCKTTTKTILEDAFKCYSWMKIRLIIDKLIKRGKLKKEGILKGTLRRTIYHIVNYDNYVLQGVIERTKNPIKKTLKK